jgi:hypothetical protein
LYLAEPAPAESPTRLSDAALTFVARALAFRAVLGLAVNAEVVQEARACPLLSMLQQKNNISKARYLGRLCFKCRAEFIEDIRSFIWSKSINPL